MTKDKQIEMHKLAKQMSEAISTAIEQRYIEDEAKLEVVLKENGWCKATDIAKEIFKDIDHMLLMMFEEYASLGHREYSAVIEVVHHKLRALEKKYVEASK